MQWRQQYLVWGGVHVATTCNHNCFMFDLIREGLVESLVHTRSLEGWAIELELMMKMGVSRCSSSMVDLRDGGICE